MFDCGDYIVCRSGGIWCVKEKHNDILKLSAYLTNFEKTLQADDHELIRKISPKEKIAEAIERVGFIRTIQAPNDKIRKEFYDTAMAKFEEIDWISVIKTVYLRQQERRLMPRELAYGQKAKTYFHSEISILFQVPFHEVEKYISDAVANDTW